MFIKTQQNPAQAEIRKRGFVAIVYKDVFWLNVGVADGRDE